MRIKAFCSVALVSLTLAVMAAPAMAQQGRVEGLTSMVPTQAWRTEALSHVDRTWMDGLRQRVDEIARTQLGQQLRGDASDLELIQRILNEKLVPATDSQTLQGMGIVLGDQLQRDLKLNWTVYNDRLGRSRALEIPGANEFVFPVTMISRRVESGADANVQALYDEVVEIVAAVRNRSSPF